MCNVGAHCTLGKACHKWGMSVVIFFFFLLFMIFLIIRILGTQTWEFSLLLKPLLPFQF